MRRLIPALFMSTVLCAGMPARADTDVSFSLSIGERDGYYLGLSNYYGIPQDRVSLLVRRGLPYEDVTVALYIADLARVDPFMVADLRLSGMRWIEVSHYYGLGADVYYVDEEPYGPYVGYYEPYRTHPRSSWASIMLSDVAIINLSNLRFAYQHYGVSAHNVMRYRARGDNFLNINHRLFRERGRMPMRPVSRHRVRPQSLPERFRVEARRNRDDGVNRRNRDDGVNRRDRANQTERNRRPQSADAPRNKSRKIEKADQQRIDRREAQAVEDRRKARRDNAAEQDVRSKRNSRAQERAKVVQPSNRERGRQDAKAKEDRSGARKAESRSPGKADKDDKAGKKDGKAGKKAGKKDGKAGKAGKKADKDDKN